MAKNKNNNHETKKFNLRTENALNENHKAKKKQQNDIQQNNQQNFQ